MNYYPIDEVIDTCIKKGISSDVAHYVREGILQPLVYIESLPGYVQKLLNDQATIIGHARLSAYWNIGSSLIAVIDSIFSGNPTFLGDKFGICKLYLEELQEAQLLCWRTQPLSLFNKFPPHMLALQDCNISEIWRFVLEHKLCVTRKQLFIKRDELISLLHPVQRERFENLTQNGANQKVENATLISSNQDDDSIFKLIGSEKKAGKQGSHYKEKRKLILKYAIGVILYNPSAYSAPHIANMMEKINKNIENETLARKKILEEINRYIKHPNFIHWSDNSERLHGIILHKVFQLKDRCSADRDKFIELAADEAEKLAFDLKLPHSIEEIKNILDQSKRLIKPAN